MSVFGWLFGGSAPGPTPTTPPPAIPPPAAPPPPTPPPSPPPVVQPMPQSTPNVVYTRAYPTLNNSSITTKINNLYPECTYEDANALDVTVVDNYDTPAGGGGIGWAYINHEVNVRTGGGESLHHNVTLNAELRSGFNISHTQVTQSKRLSGGYADSVWFNSWGPDSNFATTPDASGIVHEFNAGGVRIGEVNYGNAWGDFGMVTRGTGSRWVAGLEFFPDWLTGSTGDAKAHHYHASWAVGIGGAGVDAYGVSPKNWLGLTVFVNGIVGKNDHANLLPGSATGNTSGGGGYALDLHGSSDNTNPIGKMINIADAMDVGIDTRSAHFTEAAMMLADDQVIRLGSTFLRGHQGKLQASANGVVWKDIFSP